MEGCEIMPVEIFDVHKGDGQCVSYCQRSRRARGGYNIIWFSLFVDFSFEQNITVLCQLGIFVSRNANEFYPYSFDKIKDGYYFFCVPGVGNGNDNIIFDDRSQGQAGS